MTETAIIPIRPGLEPSTAKANPDVVAECEKLLEQARAGEVIGFAVITLHPGDLTSYQRAGRITRGVLGALSMLQYEMCKND